MKPAQSFVTASRLTEYREFTLHALHTCCLWLARQLLLTALVCFPILFWVLPDRYKTETRCLEVIKRRGRAIRFIPHYLQTKSMAWVAVTRRASNLKYVAALHVDQSLCDFAFEFDLAVIRYIPKTFRHADMYRRLVQHHWSNIHLVPREARDEQICEIALRQSLQALPAVPTLTRKLQAIAIGMKRGQLPKPTTKKTTSKPTPSRVNTPSATPTAPTTH